MFTDQTKDIRIALVGGGAIAEEFYLPAITKLSKIKDSLILVECNSSRAEKIAQKFGIKQVTDDYHKVLGQTNAAIVAVPHQLHFSISSDFLKHNAHVLCEKPLAESAEDVAELDRLAKAHNVTISVNNTRRLYPSYQKVKELITEGAIGTVQSVDYYEGAVFNWPTASGFYFNSKKPRGVLLDRGAHVLDLIAWWLEGEQIEITHSLNDSFGGPEAIVQIRFATESATGEVRLSWLNKFENKYHIRGDKGIIDGDVYDWRKVTLSDASGKKRTFKNGHFKEYKDFTVTLVDNFVGVVEGSQEPLIPGIQVKESIAMLDIAYANSKSFELNWYTNLEKVGAKAETSEKILVTGAGGFIGGWIAEALHLKGVKVHAGIRRWASAARIGRFPMEIVPCDVLDKEQINKAMAEVTQVVHCAVGSEEVTVQGTANILEAAKKFDIKKVVHISTVSVYGDVTGTVDESTPYKYTGNTYGDSKIEAEKVCWKYHEQGVPVSIIRPTFVYGPYSKSWTIRFAERFSSRRWGIYEPYGEGFADLLYIEDLVSAIMLFLEGENAVGEAFNISGPEIITWNEYFKRFNHQLGFPPLRKDSSRRMRLKSSLYEPIREIAKFLLNKFPKLFMKAYVRYDTAKFLMKDAEHSLKTTPTPAELDLYSRKTNYKTDKATMLLGYQPKYSVNKGIGMSVEWLRHQGFL